MKHTPITLKKAAASKSSTLKEYGCGTRSTAAYQNACMHWFGKNANERITSKTTSKKISL